MKHMVKWLYSSCRNAIVTIYVDSNLVLNQTQRRLHIYIYTTPVVEIKSATLWYITDIPCFVATFTIYGVTSHIP